jgi:hypothetical protein
MKYLALPSEEKLKLRSQPFDAKKACWIPDPKESFIAADIESTKDDQVTVKTSKGEVCRFILNKKNNPLHQSLFYPDKNSEKGRRSTNESTKILVY